MQRTIKFVGGLALACGVLLTPVVAAAQTATVDCLTVTAPKGWSKSEDRFGGVIFTELLPKRSNGITYHASMSITAQPAETKDAAEWRARVLADYTDQYDQAVSSGIKSASLRKPAVKKAKLAGFSALEWRIDTETAIAGQPIAWRTIERTIVHNGVFYRISTSGEQSSDVDKVARTLFASASFGESCARE